MTLHKQIKKVNAELKRGEFTTLDEMVNEKVCSHGYLKPHDVSAWMRWGEKQGYYQFFEKKIRDEERKKIGLEFKKWFNRDNGEPIEDAIERITGVKI